MTLNILTLKIGSKYGSEYINRLYKAIKRNTTLDFNFYCYTEDSTGIIEEVNIIPLTLRDDVVKQWYKIDFHNMPEIEGKCLILDIDYVILNNLDDILGWQLELHQFGCQERWWSKLTHFCRINGGFQMFYQGQTKHLYDKFYEDPQYWQNYYINRGEAEGPVNGEQNFIDNNVDMERSWLPSKWFAKYHSDEMEKLQQRWLEKIDPYEPFFIGNEFCESIKMVHFSNADNAMHHYENKWIKEYWYD